MLVIRLFHLCLFAGQVVVARVVPKALAPSGGGDLRGAQMWYLHHAWSVMKRKEYCGETEKVNENREARRAGRLVGWPWPVSPLYLLT